VAEAHRSFGHHHEFPWYAGLGVNLRERSEHHTPHGGTPASAQTKEHDAVVSVWRKAAHVGYALIEREKDSSPATCSLHHYAVGLAGKPF